MLPERLINDPLILRCEAALEATRRLRANLLRNTDEVRHMMADLLLWPMKPTPGDADATVADGRRGGK
jgi:hypothetical protein